MPTRNLAALTLIAGLACQQACQQDEARESSPARAVGAAATVNGISITRGEYEGTLRHAEEVFSLQRGSMTAQERAALAGRILDKMIETELLVQHARAEGIRVAAEEIEAELGRMHEAADGRAAFFGSLEEHGLSRKDIRAHMRRTLVLRLLRERMRSRIEVTEEELRKHFAEHKQLFSSPGGVEIAHILFRQGPGKNAPLDRAQRVRGEIQEGVSFEKAAARYSDDALTRDSGGLLGVMRKGEMHPDLEKAAFSLQAGGVSSPVSSPLGIHLLKLVGRQPGREPRFEDVRELVLDAVVEAKLEKQLADLIEHLASQAVIQRGPS